MDRKTNNGKQETTRHIFECEGSTVKRLTIEICLALPWSSPSITTMTRTIETYKQMIGKEGPQTDDMNGVSQSAKIVRKKMEERTKIKTIVSVMMSCCL